MDITLPDGSLFTDAPDDYDDDQLSELLIQGGYTTPEEAPTILAANKKMAEASFWERTKDMGVKFGAGGLDLLGGLTDRVQPDPRPEGVWAAEEAAAGAAKGFGAWAGMESLEDWGSGKEAEIEQQYIEEDKRRAAAGEMSLEQERQGQIATRGAEMYTDSASYLRDYYLSEEQKSIDEGLGGAIGGGMWETAKYVASNPSVVLSTFAESIPAMLFGGGVGRLAGYGGRAAGVAGSIAGEAGSASVMNAQQVQEVISGIPDTELMMLPEAEDILAVNPDTDTNTIRSILMSRATNTTFATSLLSNALVLGASQSLGMNVVQDMLSGTRKLTADTIGKRTAKGMAGEAGQEFFQEAGDSIAEDIGKFNAGLITVDEIGDNAAGSGLLGALVGAPTGGIAGALSQGEGGLDLETAKELEKSLREKHAEAVQDRRGFASEAQKDSARNEETLSPEDYIKSLFLGVSVDPQEYLNALEEEQDAFFDGDVEGSDILKDDRISLEQGLNEDPNASPELLALFNVKDGNQDNYAQRLIDNEEEVPQAEGRPSVEREEIDESHNFKLNKVRELVNSNVYGAGLGDIQVKIVERIENMVGADGKILYGIRKRKQNDGSSYINFDNKGEYVFDQGTSPLGRWDANLGTIFLSADRAYREGITKENFEKNILSTLNHEKVHALRSLDLFTPNEWRVLVNAAKKHKSDSDGKSYFEKAQILYDENNEYIQEEEGVAELVRNAYGNISGEPRRLIEKLLNFFESMRNMINGSGFNSFEDIFKDMESGKIGKRERGKVRDFVRAPEANREMDIIRGADSRIKGKQNILNLLGDKLEQEGTLSEPDKEEALRLGNEINAHILETGSKLGFDPQKGNFDYSQLQADITDAQLLDRIRDQAAYHGSGAIFDKFKTDHIGEGEGMQVRGWGLYFGEQEKTGQHYYKMLSKDTGTGALYKVDIPDVVIEQMLDLDRPINEQSPRIQNLAKELGIGFNVRGQQSRRSADSYTGEDLQDAIISMFRSQNMVDTGEAIIDQSQTGHSPEKSASLWLAERGVPGNKFEDGWSRNKTASVLVNGVDTSSRAFDYGAIDANTEYQIDTLLTDIESGAMTVEQTEDFVAEDYNDYPEVQKWFKKNKIEFKQPKITQNYVVFDENDVDIKTINGESVDTGDSGTRDMVAPATDAEKNFDAPDTGYIDHKTAKDTASWLRWKVQDKLLGLHNIEDKINRAREGRGQAPLSALESAYTGEELSFGRIGEKARTFNNGELKELAQAIAASGVEISQLDEFLVLRHALERNQRVRMINPEMTDHGAGSLNGNLLTDAFVINEMDTRFGMTWDADRGIWLGGNAQATKLNDIAENNIDPMVKGTLDEALDGGLITQTDHDTLTGGASLMGGSGQGFYKYYAPLRGHGTNMLSEISDAINKQSKTSGAGGSNSITGKQMQKAKGRTSESYSPIATLVADRERTIARSVKNRDIGNRLYELILENPNPDVWELIGPGHPRKGYKWDSSFKYVGSHPDLTYGTKKRDITGQPDPNNWVKQVVDNTMETPLDAAGEGLLGVKVNGEQFYIDIKDENLKQSLGNLNPQSANGAIKLMGNINRVLSFVNTTLNPEFVLGNFFRDLQTGLASIVNETGMEGGMLEGLDTKKLSKDVVKGLGASGKVFYRNQRGKTLGKDDQAEIDEFMNAGAKADWFHSRPAEQQRSNIQNMVDMENGTHKGNAIAKMKAVKSFVEDVNSAVENAVRFSTFKVARDEFIAKGMPRDQAVEQSASMAKNMTINFNRKGESGNLLNSLYLFFNAQVQGTAVILRGVAGSNTKRGILGAMTGFGALMSMLHHWAEDDDEDGLEKVEDYVRERNMIIPFGFFGMDNLKIPLPYGYNLFYQLGSNAYMMTTGKMSPEKAMVELGKTAIASFSPLGAPSGEASEVMAKMVLPTAATPFIEMTANKNYFGSPITKENYDFGTPIPDSHRTFKNSSEVFKWITQGMNELTGGNESESGFIDISPDTISYMLSIGLGGAGSFGERALLKPAERLYHGEVPFEDANSIPFLRRFAHQYSDRPNTEAFYERRDEVYQKMNHLENVRGDDRREYVEENIEYIRFEGVFKQMEKQIKILRRQQKMIDEAIARNPDRGVDLAENQQRIQEAIDRLIQRTNDMYEERVGK